MPSKKSQLQLYADECFPVPSATYLRSLGISLLYAYDKNYVQKTDRFHLEQSKKLKRVLLTLDRDFNEYENTSLKGYPGVIIISTGSTIPINVNRISQKMLKTLNPSFVKEALIKVTTSKIIKIKEGVRTERVL